MLCLCCVPLELIGISLQGLNPTRQIRSRRAYHLEKGSGWSWRSWRPSGRSFLRERDTSPDKASWSVTRKRTPECCPHTPAQGAALLAAKVCKGELQRRLRSFHIQNVTSRGLWKSAGQTSKATLHFLVFRSGLSVYSRLHVTAGLLLLSHAFHADWYLTRLRLLSFQEPVYIVCQLC